MLILSRIGRMASRGSPEIVPHVYQLTDGGVNMMLIVEEELCLIDTGFRNSSSRIAGFLHSLGRSAVEISLIIITHNHFDHIGGLAELSELTGAKVAAHSAGIVDAAVEPAYLGGIRKLLRFPLFSNLRRRFTLGPDDVDIKLEDGEVLKPLGGLKVVHTPGHTADSISLYSPQNRLLIVGDALVRRRKILQFPYRMVSSDLTQAVDSVKKMAELDFDILCFGHGRPIAGGAHAKLAALIEKGRG